MVEAAAIAADETPATVDTPADADSMASAHSTELSNSAPDVAVPSPASLSQDPPDNVGSAASRAGDEADPAVAAGLSDSEDGGESSGDELEVAIEEVLKRAKTLGEHVEALERAEEYHADDCEEDQKEVQAEQDPGSSAVEPSSDLAAESSVPISAPASAAEDATTEATEADAIAEPTEAKPKPVVKAASLEQHAATPAGGPATPSQSAEAANDVPAEQEDTGSEAGTEEFEVV